MAELGAVQFVGVHLRQVLRRQSGPHCCVQSQAQYSRVLVHACSANQCLHKPFIMAPFHPHIITEQRLQLSRRRSERRLYGKRYITYKSHREAENMHSPGSARALQHSGVPLDRRCDVVIASCAQGNSRNGKNSMAVARGQLVIVSRKRFLDCVFVRHHATTLSTEADCVLLLAPDGDWRYSWAWKCAAFPRCFGCPECRAEVATHASTCWCDADCVEHGDCCDDYMEKCIASPISGF